MQETSESFDLLNGGARWIACEMKEFLTKEHKELIHKKIVKTIEDMDFTSIIEDFINDELDYVRDRDNVDEFLEEQIIEIVRQHLVKSGLLKENK